MTPAAALAELVTARRLLAAADEAGDVAAVDRIDGRIAVLEAELESQVAATPADLLAQAEHLAWLAEVLPGALTPAFAHSLRAGLQSLCQSGGAFPPGAPGPDAAGSRPAPWAVGS